MAFGTIDPTTQRMIRVRDKLDITTEQFIIIADRLYMIAEFIEETTFQESWTIEELRSVAKRLESTAGRLRSRW